MLNLKRKFKNSKFLSEINALTKHHINNSSEYKIILEKAYNDKIYANSIDQVPFLPVRLFKEVELRSTPKSEIIKTMRSSGTSSAGVSKIFLDKETSANQIKALTKIVSNFIGSKRKPILIIDSKSIISNRNEFSARTTGVLGFSIFGKDIEYALDNDLNINIRKIDKFINKYKNEEVLIFGFTFVIWKKFLNELEKHKKKLNLQNGVLIHGGGWKKLKNEMVSDKIFKKKINTHLNISRVHNYYGMVEQTGSIFMECEHGYFHTSEFSSIIIRDQNTFSKIGFGKPGLIQLLSIIPRSYPGHSILSEDIGIIYGFDDCKCGRKGNYFKVMGRIEEAEIRGCSDTFTS